MYSQAKAREAARLAIDAQRILTVWQVKWRQRHGRRIVDHSDILLSHEAALGKHDLYKAMGYMAVDLQPLLVYTHDTPNP